MRVSLWKVFRKLGSLSSALLSLSMSTSSYSLTKCVLLSIVEIYAGK